VGAALDAPGEADLGEDALLVLAAPDARWPEAAVVQRLNAELNKALRTLRC
jgi:hypothetical protein